MQFDGLEIGCPHCGEPITVERPDFSELEVSYTTDCEVCCRPMRIAVVWEAGENEPFVSVEPEN